MAASLTSTASAKLPAAATLSAIRSWFRRVVPSLDAPFHKGQHGCIGVVGGSFEYTGAPFFAAMSALRTGSDLVHVFCTPQAASPIKCYSPELIVHPCLPVSDGHPSSGQSSASDGAGGGGDSAKDPHLPKHRESGEGGTSGSLPEVGVEVDTFRQWLPRMSCLVVGPGLGRDEKVLEAARTAILYAVKLDLPVVIDADGLFLVSQRPECISGYEKAVLTPNVAEFRRLWTTGRTLKGGTTSGPESAGSTEEEVPPASMESVAELASMFGGITVMCKGPDDLIFSQAPDATVPAVASSRPGSKRRCGGQGDLLSGCTATFVSWAHKAASRSGNECTGESSSEPMDLALACWCASTTVRLAANLTFKAKGRSMLAHDVLDFIGPAFEEVSGELEE